MRHPKYLITHYNHLNVDGNETVIVWEKASRGIYNAQTILKRSREESWGMILHIGWWGPNSFDALVTFVANYSQQFPGGKAVLIRTNSRQRVDYTLAQYLL